MLHLNIIEFLNCIALRSIIISYYYAGMSLK